MAQETLTQRKVDSYACPEGQKKAAVYDGKCKGLVLEIRPTGTKTYFLRYKGNRGKTKQLKLGRAHYLSLQQAREKARNILADVAMGKDPQAEKKVLEEVPTFKSFAWGSYLPYVKSYKRSWETDESLLRIHLIPRFGKLHLDQISRDKIIDLHQEQLANGAAPASANRLVILLRYMFNLANNKWEIPGTGPNPIQGVPLAKVNNQRERYLTEEEVHRLSQAVKESENPMLEPIISMLILTGARKSEVLHAKWEDIDLERRRWRIPHTKSGKPRTVPLSGSALEIPKAGPPSRGISFYIS